MDAMQKHIGKYIILRTLGSGGTCKVKLGRDTETNRNVAVKIIKDNLGDETYKYVMAEVEAMQALSHRNILNQIEYGKAMYEKPNGNSREVTYIVLELAEVGDLFDVVANSGAFSEEMTRFYMKRFLEGLQYCHNHGIVHRDIKIENCLLDKDFEIKINDFGFAAPTEGRDGSGELQTKLGTECNMAPELLDKMPYSGASVDLFATAIVAFTMISQHPPFHKASQTDYYYKFIAKNHTGMFWDKHSGSKDTSDFYSEEFKDLFSSMTQYEPAHRPSIGEVLAHPWFQGPIMQEDEVKATLNSRLDDIRSAQEAARQERRAARLEAGDAVMSAGNVRNADLLDQIATMQQKFDPSSLNKKIKTIDGPFINNGTYFFSQTSPDIIELVMRSYLSEAKNVHSVDKDKYKMKFTLTGKNLDGDDYEVEIKMQMLQYKSDTVYVEFQKISGDQFYFLKHYKELVQGTKVMKDGQVEQLPGPLLDYDNQPASEALA